jgi:predicted amidohydrolase
MSVPPAMTRERRSDAWRGVPMADRRLIATMIVVCTANRIIGAHYDLLPPEWEKRLKRCGRSTLFGIFTECLARITRVPHILRAKPTRRAPTVKRR